MGWRRGDGMWDAGDWMPRSGVEGRQDCRGDGESPGL